MMGASSGSNNHNQPQPPLNMLPPRWSNGNASNPNQVQESISTAESSHHKIVKTENDITTLYTFPNSNKISLQDIAREKIDIISDKMHMLPENYLTELKTRLRETLEGSSKLNHHEDLFLLQKLVQTRSDLNAMTLLKAHRVHLEILVAINSGIQAFLHPNVKLSQSVLIEIFTYKRCRNIACQNLLPAEECRCNVCVNQKGFCNLCMCTICTKFDFEVNTCRWIGCDSCSHWTHTDCAIRENRISSLPKTVFCCRACSQKSELLGWVNDVFRHCAQTWTREQLMQEVDFVSRIFRGSEDSREKMLFWKCEEIIEKLKSGVHEANVSRVILSFFEELGLDAAKRVDSGVSGTLILPQDACNKICEVVEEAIKKMEIVANEKIEMVEKARLDLQDCDRELEDKAREIAELKLERHQKKQQIEELESIVRLKQAEADMFQAKADEARREAESLQSIVFAKSKRSEEDYAATYLKLRLSEAEAERQYLSEKIKVHDNSYVGGGGDSSSSSSMMYSKIQDLLKNVYTKSS